MKFQIQFFAICILLIAALANPRLFAQETTPTQKAENTSNENSLHFDFEATDENWEFTDPAAWRFSDAGKLSLHQKKSTYQPPHRSPLHIALLKEHEFADFQLDVDVHSTHEDYNHRDVCLFFGYQGPTRFYYVHLGKKTDPHANQIFIVNDSARTKISLTTTDGTTWDEQWHHVRIKRDIGSGDIQVYFDNMESPVMTANDKTFTSGRIGLGSFDDTADFDELIIEKGLRE